LLKNPVTFQPPDRNNCCGKKVVYKTFSLGRRCPEGADEGRNFPPHQSKIKDFCQLPPRGKLLGAAAPVRVNNNFSY
jgi:hypothetical protein